MSAKLPPLPKLSMQEFARNAYLDGNSADYVEALYEAYLADPNQVPSEWRNYFASLQVPGQTDYSHAQIREHIREQALHPTVVIEESGASKQCAVDQLINAYRRYGHYVAKIDPLQQPRRAEPRLELNYYDLMPADLTAKFATRGVLPETTATLEKIVAKLKSLYCSSIGIECFYVDNADEQQWLQNTLEQRFPKLANKDEKITVLKQLIASNTLETYLDAKYVGQKRFSIEGAESLIPMLQEMIRRSGAQQVKEIVMGMAHRGRLNVLVNIMGKSAADLFAGFEAKKDYGPVSGDVKYHDGYVADVKTPGGDMHLALLSNPSHLEFICPVVAGSVRARQDRQGEAQYNYALPIMIHGDAAFIGQGTIQETLNMETARAYNVGGSVHIIVNNQVGFTTSNVQDARSTTYCSDIAKMLNAPIFHVNGDDAEAVIAVTQIAIDYRMKFNKDVFIDLVCYRRYGHQEIDEPTATQPLMYQGIKTHPNPAEVYSTQLIKDGVCTPQQVEQWIDEFRQTLDAGKKTVDTFTGELTKKYNALWQPFLNQSWKNPAKTAVPLADLKKLGQALDQLPADFKLQRQVSMTVAARAKMTNGELPLDWGYAEIMAYATLLTQGYPVRLVGEDVRRGTFFHRHSTLFNQANGDEYVPLKHLGAKEARLQIYDSVLSENAAMAFEYGYASTDPNTLNIWEAQYGDFANGAQVIIDQFLSSSWQKWEWLCGLILFLPHAYSGEGPEHTSARLERYLQLCAQENMQVCFPTTPAQIFHLLRRQVIRQYRTPLVVMSPKNLLRHKLAVSTFEDLASGEFHCTFDEIDPLNTKQIKRVILCTGKVYYDLLTARREKNIEDIAILRIEQLYPFPFDEVKALLQKYVATTEIMWVQEEPFNQGAWLIMQHRFIKCLAKGQTLACIARPPSAAPAVGFAAVHQKEQQLLIEQALSLATRGTEYDD